MSQRVSMGRRVRTELTLKVVMSIKKISPPFVVERENITSVIIFSTREPPDEATGTRRSARNRPVELG